MDGSRFDAWTRRKFGLATGGAIASLIGLAALPEAEAKKKNKNENNNKNKKKNKKQCRKIGQSCDINKKNQQCCKSGQDCAQVKGLNGNVCCKELNSNCSQNTDCCGDRRCRNGICQNP